MPIIDNISTMYLGSTKIMGGGEMKYDILLQTTANSNFSVTTTRNYDFIVASISRGNDNAVVTTDIAITDPNGNAQVTSLWNNRRAYYGGNSSAYAINVSSGTTIAMTRGNGGGSGCGAFVIGIYIEK